MDDRETRTQTHSQFSPQDICQILRLYGQKTKNLTRKHLKKQSKISVLWEENRVGHLPGGGSTEDKLGSQQKILDGQGESEVD